MIACSQCGKLNPENFNYCLECGAELHPDESHSAESHFFIELSAKSPDIKALRKQVGDGETPIPTPAPSDERVLLHGAPDAAATPKSTGTEDGLDEPSRVGSIIVELSPDDLTGDIADQDLSSPEPNQSTESSLPPPEDTDSQPFETLEPPIPSEAELAEIAPSDAELSEEEPPPSFTEPVNQKTASGLPADAPNCPSCGALVKINDNFCSKCGTPNEFQEAVEGGKTVFMQPPSPVDDSEQPVGRLVLVDNAGKDGEAFSLVHGDTLCGRSEGAILIDDAHVSPQHCTFSYIGDQMFVKDMQSTNGIFIRLQDEALLKSNSFFRIGQQLLYYLAVDDFEMLPEAEASADTRFLGSNAESIWGILCVVASDGSIFESIYLKNPTVLIGRETGDLTFPNDAFVSAKHIELSANNDGACILKDLGSSNGTFLKVENIPLNANDTLLIGQKLLRFEYL